MSCLQSCVHTVALVGCGSVWNPWASPANDPELARKLADSMRRRAWNIGIFAVVGIIVNATLWGLRNNSTGMFGNIMLVVTQVLWFLSVLILWEASKRLREEDYMAAKVKVRSLPPSPLHTTSDSLLSLCSTICSYLFSFCLSTSLTQTHRGYSQL